MHPDDCNQPFHEVRSVEGIDYKLANGDRVIQDRQAIGASEGSALLIPPSTSVSFFVSVRANDPG